MMDAAVLPPGVIRIDTSGRRQYSVEYKQRLAQLTLEPGASVAGIALQHRLNANQLFKWRRWYLRQLGLTVAGPVPTPAAMLLPVVVAPADRPPTEPTAVVATTERDVEPPPTEPGQIEIALGRTRVRVTGAVDPALLETILTHLQRR
ncbi:MAG: transposase [Gammaproteobacteria bacterium]|nr:transposase [Gammaproteobacteria bacterium]